MMSSEASAIKPILKKHGQIMLEEVPDLILCKSRLIPLKSLTLEKLEKMQQEAQLNQEKVKENQEQ